MVSFYQKEYPRPQFVRKDWVNLNGSWDFAFDDQNLGLQQEWNRSFPSDSRKILVPFTYETAMSGIHDETVHEVVWYRRQVDLSGMDQGKRVILHFEGVDYASRIYVDGQLVGTHEGGYSRFSFDITDCLHGKQSVTLTLRVEDSLDEDQPRGKQRYKHESWGCWYVQTTGIWKTVWLEQVNDASLKLVSITPDYAQKTVMLETEYSMPGSQLESHTFELQANVSFAGCEVTSIRFPVTKNVQKLTIPAISDAAIWSPDSPNLYEICFVLTVDGQETDRVCSYFAFREFRTEGDRLLLNGEPIFLRMILDQGYWQNSGITPPSEEALIRDIEIAHRFGYNGLRKHQKTEDERFLYFCDCMGMLVWSEMAACYDISSRCISHFAAEWASIVRQYRNHPSIITWVPFNESWGIPHVRDSLIDQSFVNSIYYLTKALDPTRPVVTNDGWEHTISDIITIHDYREYGSELEEAYLDSDRAILSNQKSMSWYGQLVFAGDYRYNGQPVILSEYGGIALHSEKGWGYGNQVSEEELLKRLLSQNAAIHKTPYFSGFCYTQLTDVRQEVNGLVNMAREDKLTNEAQNAVADSNRKTGSRA